MYVKVDSWIYLFEDYTWTLCNLLIVDNSICSVNIHKHYYLKIEVIEGKVKTRTNNKHVHSKII